MKAYVEPMDYIHEDIRKEYKLGEYNEEVMNEVKKMEEEEKAENKDSKESDK